MKRLLIIGACGLLLSGCATVTQIATSVATASGVITQAQADALNRSAVAVEKTFQDITPEQEYYLGRTVGSSILSRYSVQGSNQANRYLNLVGQTLARASDKPETYNGYHFLILDSDQINAFAAPGGLIFISKGMIELCQSEDDLAAVLAHEVGHVQLSHALKAIKTSRITSALTVIATESVKSFGNENLSTLTQTFESSIDDITQTLTNSGYARGQERDADAAAVTILQRVGYDPSGLVRVLERMKARLRPGSGDFASTHPDPNDRIADLRSLLRGGAESAPVAARQQRFDQFIRQL